MTYCVISLIIYRKECLEMKYLVVDLKRKHVRQTKVVSLDSMFYALSKYHAHFSDKIPDPLDISRYRPI